MVAKEYALSETKMFHISWEIGSQPTATQRILHPGMEASSAETSEESRDRKERAKRISREIKAILSRIQKK